MKKKFLIVSLCMVLLAMTVAGSLAYYTASEVARNVITTGSVKIDLIETDAEGNPYKDPTGVVPGQAVDKVVTVENVGKNACWVRIKADRSIELAEGVQGQADPSLLEIDFDTENWTEKDGWFYYSEKLEPGETTKPLFTKVLFKASMVNLYAGCTAEVTVSAQGVQYANNGSAVLEAKGWPAE